MRTLLLVALLTGCATVQAERPSPPPTAPALATVTKEIAVSVRGNPDVAVFRSVLERTLGRAGFRVVPGEQPDAVTLGLLGNGSGTSEANEAGSAVRQSLSIDMTISVGGRLQGERRSAVDYVAAYDKNDPGDSFAKFNTRVGQYNKGAFEYIAVDLTNQLVSFLTGK